MSGSIIVINVDIRETRIALIEDGVIAELQIERAAHRGTVGNVVLGRVTRVLPGMQAAFIDVGQERSAFLHVEDLIRPADFDRYLAESGGEDAADNVRGSGDRKRSQETFGSEDEDDGPILSGDEEGSGLDEASRIEVEDDLVSPAAVALSSEDVPARRSRRRRRRSRRGGPMGVSARADGPDRLAPEVLEEGDSEGDEGVPYDDGVGAAPAGVDEPPAATFEDTQLLGERPWSTLTAHSEEQADDLSGDVRAETDATSIEELEGDGDFDADESELDTDGPSVGEAAHVSGIDYGSGLFAGGPGDDLDDLDEGEHDEQEEEHDEQEVLAGVVAEVLVQPDPDAVAAVNGVVLASHREVGTRIRSRHEGPRPKGRQRARALRANRSGADRSGGDRSGSDRSRRGAPNGAAAKAPLREGLTPARVNRSVPITEVVKEGDPVVVQISKEPIGTKGARVTSHISLPGRYVVYLPTVDHLGISKRIGSGRERARLRSVMESLKPARGGLIVRTVAEGLTKKQLKADVGYLMRVWADICRKREQAKPPTELYTELDLPLKVARDLFTDDVKRIIIDDRDQYGRLCRFVEMFLPERVKDIELYTGEEPIFDAYGIEDEIARSLSRKVPLPSGGSLIVDQAEALTAIDVNTGRYVGKGSKDLEETALKTNLEAVEEIAYQLRLRNIGGLVILDLIDMERSSNRDKVWRALESALAKDKAKTTLNRISELGLIEMTRKRTRESLGRTLHEPCFYCDGTGLLLSKETISYEILRQIGRDRRSLPGYSVVVNAHPAIVDFLKTEERAAVVEAERRYTRRIEFVARAEYHLEQFDLHGK